MKFKKCFITDNQRVMRNPNLRIFLLMAYILCVFLVSTSVKHSEESETMKHGSPNDIFSFERVKLDMM